MWQTVVTTPPPLTLFTWLKSCVAVTPAVGGAQQGMSGEDVVRAAARFAAQVGASHLSLTSFTKEYPPDRVGPLLKAGVTELGHDRVSAARDMLVVDVEARRSDDDLADGDEGFREGPDDGLDWSLSA